MAWRGIRNRRRVVPSLNLLRLARELLTTHSPLLSHVAAPSASLCADHSTLPLLPAVVMVNVDAIRHCGICCGGFSVFAIVFLVRPHRRRAGEREERAARRSRLHPRVQRWPRWAHGSGARVRTRPSALISAPSDRAMASCALLQTETRDSPSRVISRLRPRCSVHLPSLSLSLS